MTCPYRDKVLPSRREFLRVLKRQTMDLFLSEPRWDNGSLHLSTKNGCRCRIAPPPRWQFDQLESETRYPSANREGTLIEGFGERFYGGRAHSASFRGEGLLLPPKFEATLRDYEGSPATMESERNANWQAPGADAMAAEIIDDWVRKCDHDAIAAVCAFSESFSGRSIEQIFHWRFLDSHLPLAICLRVPGFERLLDAHPQLAMLLARTLWDSKALHTDSGTELRTTLALGPVALLKVLGLPANADLLKVIRRISISSLTESVVSDLSIVASDRTRLRKLLQLPPPIFAEDIALQAVEGSLTLSLAKAIHELLQEEKAIGGPGSPDAGGFSIVHECLELLYFRSPDELQAIRRIRSMTKFRSELLRMDRAYAPTWNGDPKTRLKPPFPERADIAFLKTPEEIIEASLEFRNCASSLVADAVAGDTALYVVRAGRFSGMLQLKRNRKADWKMVRLLGPCNQAPAPSVDQLARQWLDQHLCHLQS